MATSEDTSASAVAESKRARDVVDRNIAALKPLLESLGYRDDLRYLDGFTTRFEEYKRLDDEIVTLAVEGTNVKAQRLSFGPAQQAADAFRKALEAAASHATSNKDRVDALAGKARAAVLEIQVMHAPHIAEPDDTVDDAHGRTNGGVGNRGSQRPERIAGCVAPRCRVSSWRRQTMRSIAFSRSMPRSSRCHAGTATFARSRCCLGARGWSLRNARISYVRWSRRSRSTSSPRPADARFTVTQGASVTNR